MLNGAGSVTLFGFWKQIQISLKPPWYQNMKWKLSLWTHVNLVLSSLLRIDWSVNPSLCLLNDDSGLCISSMQKRMLFAGFTAVKKTIIQNWFTPHMCGKTYWIHSLLQIVTCECATARVGGARPSTIDAWQCFLFDIRLYKGVTFVFLLSFPLSLPFHWTLRCWVCVCCFVLLYFGCCVVLCVKKNKKMLITKKKLCPSSNFYRVFNKRTSKGHIRSVDVCEFCEICGTFSRI